MGEKIAYIRVSTIDQDTLRQDKMMQDLGITEENTFREKISGKNADRPELQRMLQYIRKGDTVVVESLSRLGRNTKDLLSIVEEIQRKGADFVSLKETIDTSTATGKFILTVFAALAELERQNILQRQKEGIEAKKEKDRKLREKGLPAETYKGRTRAKYDPEQFKKELFLVQEGKQTHDQAAKNLGLQIRTYFRRVKELKENGEEKYSPCVPENIHDALYQTDPAVYSFLTDNQKYSKKYEKELSEISELTEKMIGKGTEKLRKERDQKLDELAAKVKKDMEQA